MAEKVRAALTRREVAIRDFFDLDFAVRSGTLDPSRPAFVDLVRRKIEVPESEPVDVSLGRSDALRSQLVARLRPVLREREYAQFDLERAIATAHGIARALAE